MVIKPVVPRERATQDVEHAIDYYLVVTFRNYCAISITTSGQPVPLAPLWSRTNGRQHFVKLRRRPPEVLSGR